MGRRNLEAVQAHLPRVRFLTLHYAYFIAVCLISSVIFWVSSTPFRSVSYVDSLFFTVSAMTLAGLNTVNLSTLNTFQQTLLFVLIMLGSAVCSLFSFPLSLLLEYFTSLLKFLIFYFPMSHYDKRDDDC